jgi:putative ABC transport system permease protein
MGRLFLITRLVTRDLRHRPAEALLLLLAITAAATTLTLGLVLHGVTTGPYQRTRAVTAGPDLVAGAFPSFGGSGQPASRAQLLQLAHAPGVTGYAGPYPVTWAALRAGGYTTPAMVEGRDETPAVVDRPLLAAGSWVRPGAVVLERSFAAALGVRAGGQVTLNDRHFTVAGIAVSAALPPYPGICSVGCMNGPGTPPGEPGLIWMTKADAESLATSAQPLAWYLNMRLADPATADGFATAYNAAHADSNTAPYLVSWQRIGTQDGRTVYLEQQILLVGSWLLGMLAVASVAVLAGGRMAGQVRRVGLLKAVGATPGLVAVVLLAEHLLVALVAAVAGLLAGWLAAPLLTSPGAGLLGSAGAPSLTPAAVGIVAAVALAVSVAATILPAFRGARTSTIAALADLTRPPKRRPVTTRISAWLPVPLLLGLRIAARRPRRALLSAASVVVMVAGLVAALTVHARLDSGFGAGGALANPLNVRASQVLMVITVALVALSVVNALLITWATAIDARRSAALTRALGATPAQVSAGLAVAQMLPSLTGAIAGIPAGLVLYGVVRQGGPMTYPPLWWLAAVLIITPLAVAALTVLPSRVAARAPVAPVLQAEAA